MSKQSLDRAFPYDLYRTWIYMNKEQVEEKEKELPFLFLSLHP
jgi:hypothetical protein